VRVLRVKDIRQLRAAVRSVKLLDDPENVVIVLDIQSQDTLLYALLFQSAIFGVASPLSGVVPREVLECEKVGWVLRGVGGEWVLESVSPSGGIGEAIIPESVDYFTPSSLPVDATVAKVVADCREAVVQPPFIELDELGDAETAE